jgi:hypothetical protein
MKHLYVPSNCSDNVHDCQVFEILSMLVDYPFFSLNQNTHEQAAQQTCQQTHRRRMEASTAI